MNDSEPMKILVFKEEDKLVAQCVDYDICTQADDIETLQSRMDCLIEIELTESAKTGQPIDPAPERFHKMWDSNPAPQSSNEYKVVAA